MPYKEGCNFRNKIQVCNFKADDCSPENCDMYNVEWSKKAIKKEFKKIRKQVVELTEKMKEMKKTGEKNTDPETYKKIKQDRKDIVLGGIYMSKAFDRVSREKRK